MVSIYRGDEASGGSGDDKIVVIDPDEDTFILCGAGEDTVVSEGKPPAGVVGDDCESVDIR